MRKCSLIVAWASTHNTSSATVLSLGNGSSALQSSHAISASRELWSTTSHISELPQTTNQPYSVNVGAVILEGLNAGSNTTSTTSALAANITTPASINATSTFVSPNSTTTNPAPLLNATLPSTGNNTLLPYANSSTAIAPTGYGSFYASSCNALSQAWSNTYNSWASSHQSIYTYTDIYTDIGVDPYSLLYIDGTTTSCYPLTGKQRGSSYVLRTFEVTETIRTFTETDTTVDASYAIPSPACSIDQEDCQNLWFGYSAQSSDYATAVGLGPAAAQAIPTPACAYSWRPPTILEPIFSPAEPSSLADGETTAVATAEPISRPTNPHASSSLAETATRKIHSETPPAQPSLATDEPKPSTNFHESTPVVESAASNAHLPSGAPESEQVIPGVGIPAASQGAGSVGISVISAPSAQDVSPGTTSVQNVGGSVTSLAAQIDSAPLDSAIAGTVAAGHAPITSQDGTPSAQDGYPNSALSQDVGGRIASVAAQIESAPPGQQYAAAESDAGELASPASQAGTSPAQEEYPSTASPQHLGGEVAALAAQIDSLAAGDVTGESASRASQSSVSVMPATEVYAVVTASISQETPALAHEDASTTLPGASSAMLNGAVFSTNGHVLTAIPTNNAAIFADGTYTTTISEGSIAIIETQTVSVASDGSFVVVDESSTVSLAKATPLMLTASLSHGPAFTVIHTGSALIAEDAGSTITLSKGCTTVFAGETMSVALNGESMVIDGSVTSFMTTAVSTGAQSSGDLGTSGKTAAATTTAAAAAARSISLEHGFCIWIVLSLSVVALALIL